MAFRKYMRAEKVEAADSKENAAIRQYVRKQGKVSASQLTDEERRGLPQER
jgi:ribosomal protein S18